MSIKASPLSNSTFASDLGASLVVFLVALPLALGIALASGAPSVVPGLIGCAVGGIVVGSLAGAPLQVTGPAAGLTVVVYDLVQRFGWETTCIITAIAGVFQIIIGRFRLGAFCLAISPAVVHGMLAGIGIIIALSQLHVVLGGKPESSAWRNLADLPQQIANFDGHSVFLGVITFSLLFVWKYLPRIVRKIPAQLGGVVIATAIANIFWLDVAKVQLPDDLFAGFKLPVLGDVLWGHLIAAAGTVAAIASVESLLCAVATDKMHFGPRANLDRELSAQGAGNIVSGLLGGLPLTGVVVRSSANVTAGGKTRLSSILHGIWIVVLVLFAANLIEFIPLPALAGLLVHVGVGLVNVHHIRELIHHREIPAYIITVLGVVFWNLLGGVAIGLVVTIFILLKRSVVPVITLSKTNAGEESSWQLSIKGVISFLAVPKLTEILGQIPQGDSVTLTLAPQFMDHAAFESITSWQRSFEARGGKVSVTMGEIKKV